MAVDRDILDMNVIDRRSECADACGNVHSLPHEMTGIEIRANDIPNCLSEMQQRRHVVNKIEWVKLETKLRHAAGLTLCSEIAPKRDRLLPLPPSHVEHILGPGIGKPIRQHRLWRIAGRPRLRNDAIHTDKTGKSDGLSRQLCVRRTQCWMKRKRAETDRRQSQSSYTQSPEKPVARLRIGK